MKAIIILTGGQGKQLMSMQIVRELAASNKYEKIWVGSTFPWWAVEAAQDDARIIPFAMARINEIGARVMKHPAAFDWLQDDVYAQSDFILGKEHFYNTLRRRWGLPTVSEDGGRGAITVPTVKLDPTLSDGVAKAKKKIGSGRFVLVCRQGGKSVLDPNKKTEEENGLAMRGFIREYPLKDAEEVCKLLRAQGVTPVQIRLSSEPQIQEAVQIDEIQLPMPGIYELAKEAAAVFTIDSCLMHVTAAVDPTKMAVVWGHTRAGGFGYKKAHNMIKDEGSLLTPQMIGLINCPIVEMPSPDEVMSVLLSIFESHE